MPKLTSSKVLITLLMLAFLFAVFTGCGEDTGGEDTDNGNGKAPLLPPDSSMTIDLAVFAAEDLGAPAPNVAGGRLNFITAASVVALINTTIVAGLATPTAIFTVAQNTTPVEQDDGSWLWSYSRSIGLRTFTANLTGKEGGGNIVWSMKISNASRVLPLENFEWYTGITAPDNSSGSWQFFDSTTPTEANPTIAIEWKIESSPPVVVKKELIFTNQKAGSRNFADVLHYSLAEGIASIRFTEAAKNTTSIIEWDVKTIAGSITAPFYNRGQKACWNERRRNIPCD